jgi:hypothetical protein
MALRAAAKRALSYYGIIGDVPGAAMIFQALGI